MDAPLISFERKEKYLLIIGHGKRDNLTSMAKASGLIYEKVLETRNSYLLETIANFKSTYT
jgi:hypothetical protein